MAIKIESPEKGEVRIEIEGRVGIEDALELYIRLKESLVGAKTLTMDMTKAERVDTSIVQLMLVSKNEVCGRGGSFIMLNPSAEVIKMLSMAGLQEELTAA